MLSIQFIRENPELVKKASEQKGYLVDINELLNLDEQRRGLQQKVEELRQERNKVAAQTKGGTPEPDLIEKGKKIKVELNSLEQGLQKVEEEYNVALESVPNIIPEDTPEGGEEANRVERHWGDTVPRDFEVKDHQTFGEERGWIDFERAAKVAGNKFYFLRGDAVQLELALTQFVMNKTRGAGFEPMIVPNMVNSRVASGTGFLPRGEERQLYKVEGEDLNLIATAEMSVTGYHADEILDLEQGPKLYAGYSPSYRLEAGAYGKHSRGLYRVHQFNKVELYVFSKPEDSEAMHERILALEEEICQALELPYQVVRIAAGDLGAPAYKKFDVEYWTPIDNRYRELMSCSNVTDYQARRLGIRYRNSDGATDYVHTLNGTAMAMSRGLIAILENYQTDDGHVRVPAVLRPYMGDVESL